MTDITSTTAAAIAPALASPITIVVLDIAILALMAIVGLAIISQRRIFAIVMLSGVYSLLAAVFFVITDAVDVAFTEAAVGAGISTVLLLGAVLLTAREARPSPPARHWSALAIVLGAGAVMFYATIDMPAFGDASSPANDYLRTIFMERTMTEVGTPNVVTAVLASYRGFDTMGEAFVIFAAGLGVMVILGLRGRRETDADDTADAAPDSATGSATDSVAGAAKNPVRQAPSTALPTDTDSHLILKVVAKLLIPMVVVFGLYVQFHGDFGPGGGFQAGVIVAVAAILYGLIYGMDALQAALPPLFVRFGCATGVAIYAGVGVLSLFGQCHENEGGVCPFLDYNVLGHGYHGQHIGIILIELGVLFTVAFVMLAVFYAFAGRQADIPEDEW